MAKLKSEVSQIYLDKNGVKLRDRLIRDSSKMAAKFSGSLASVVNTIQSTKLFRATMEKLVGFDQRRKLPQYAKETFASWFDKVKPSPEPPNRLLMLLSAWV